MVKVLDKTQLWQLQDAKSKFSQMVEEAIINGPQLVTRRGKEAVMVISVNEYQNMVEKKSSFTEFLLNLPNLGDPDFEFEREAGETRRIDFDLED